MAVDFLKVEKSEIQMSLVRSHVLFTFVIGFDFEADGELFKNLYNKKSNFEVSKLIGSIRRSATHNHIELNLF